MIRFGKKTLACDKILNNKKPKHLRHIKCHDLLDLLDLHSISRSKNIEQKTKGKVIKKMEHDVIPIDLGSEKQQR